ncbi:methylmalonyl-CoA mutase [Prosthecobacter sp. SYSU 5D2]|uniref:methylmalonyl-CoA mutase n=1 Tax=Prosthecobacter sp. SYSU 5D2 TaxID=3134134 RepID=UPI0031FE857B
MDIFATVAKLRALRGLARALAAEGDRPMPKIRACLCLGKLEGYDQACGLIRATVQAVSGILGMSDEIEADPQAFMGMDGQADVEEIRRRMQALSCILQEESGLGKVADPLAGSFLVEAETRLLAGKVYEALGSGCFKGVPFSEVIQRCEVRPTLADPGWPGLPPFIRGPYASMYLKAPWTLRQYAGFSTAEETNAFFRSALADGQRGLSVAFDLPTHRGYDSDHPRVTGDVGKAGVAIDTVEDMKRLFESIPLGQITVSMTMNGAVLPVLAFFIVTAEEQGVSLEALSGTIQNDILKEYMVRNTYIYPPGPSLRIVADVMRWLAENCPRFNSISVSGYHMHEAGATAAQELAYTLANGLAYLEAGSKAGVPAETLAARMSFFWAQGMNYQTEVAKLRAARGLWARLLWDAGIRSAKALALRCHCQTSGWSLTRQDPVNNIVRTTVEALSAVHGHTQSLHTNSLDEAVALPSDAAARIARQTQLILQKESGICSVIDPWGGSLDMEERTAALASEAMEMIDEIREAGGMVHAVAKGLPQRRIEEAAARRQANIDSGSEKIIGVNYLQPDHEAPLEIRDIDNAAVRSAQLARLQQVKATRNPIRVQESLQALEVAARDPDANLLALAIVAARERATLGEISLALEQVFGRYYAMTQVVGGVYSAAMPAEEDSEMKRVRVRVEQFARKNGRRPRMLLAKMGQDGHDRGAKVVAGAFSDFGFDVDLAPLFRTPDEVCRQAIDNDVHVIGISSLAGGHTTLVPELLRLLKEQESSHMQVIVGGIIPDGDHAVLSAQGVGAIFGPGTRLPDCAHRVMDLLEIHSSA